MRKHIRVAVAALLASVVTTLLGTTPASATLGAGWSCTTVSKMTSSRTTQTSFRGNGSAPHFAAPRQSHANRGPASSVRAGAPQTTATQIKFGTFAGTSESEQFSALGFHVTPPDPMVAAGPSSVLELFNAAGQFYAKDGTPSGSLFSLDEFFDVPNGSGYFFTDPWAVYDSATQRFFISGLAVNAPSGDDSKLYVAVSKTSTPTGATGDWNRYTIASASGIIEDQPKFGVTSDKIVLTAQDYFGLDDTNPGARIYVLQKSDATGGVSSLRKCSHYLGAGYFGFMPPRQTSSGNDGFVWSYGATDTTNIVEVRTVTGNPASNDVTDTARDYTFGPDVTAATAPRQPATSETLLVDERPITAAWQNGVLWVGVTTSCIPSGDSSTRACIRLWRVDPKASNGSGVKEDVTYGLNGLDVFCPGLTFTSNGDLHMVFGESSSSVFPSVEVTGRPSGTSGFTSPVEIAAGAASYNDGIDSGPSRWGDYYYAATDPSTPNDAWVIGQTALTTTNWVTQIGRVSFSKPSVKLLTPALGSPAGGNTITISGADFEDGVSTVSFGGVAGTNVTVTSPESLTVDVPAAVTGPGTVHVTVTNANGTSSEVQSDLYSYGGLFHPIAPQRIATLTLSSASDQLVTVGGAPNIPTSAQAGLVNVEVESPSVAGYIRVTPSDGSSQTAVQEFNAHKTISNLVAVKLGDADHKIKLHLSAGTAKVFVDAQGYYGDPTETSGADGFHSVPTARLATLTATTTYQTIDVINHAGVSSTADAVVANIEVQNPTTAGYVRATPSNQDSQTAVQEFGSDTTVSNLATIKIGPDGKIRVRVSAGTATVFVDVQGYYASLSDEGDGLRFRSLPTARIYGPLSISSSSDRVLAVRSLGGVSPNGVTAVVINVEVQDPASGGYIRVTPSDANSQTAVQEFVAHQTISNLVTVKLGSDGRVRFHLSAGSATIFVDVEGYY